MHTPGITPLPFDYSKAVYVALYIDNREIISHFFKNNQ